MINDNDKRVREKLDFFLREKVEVHVKRKDNRFWNGYLVEKKSDNVYVIRERVLGLIHLFVSDVWDVVEVLK